MAAVATMLMLREELLTASKHGEPELKQRVVGPKSSARVVLLRRTTQQVHYAARPHL
jgi:hypothetical protein